MRSLAEKVINKAQKHRNNSKEMSKLMGIVKTPTAFKKLLNDLAPRYE